MADGTAQASTSGGPEEREVTVVYKQYKDERDLPLVMNLIDNELSEPYSIFTYRYFLHTWPHLCFMAFDGERCFGTVVAKMEVHREALMRGYIAMLVVEKQYRYLGVGSELVKRAIEAMVADGCEEVALEAEVTNSGALRLYQKLGFIRDKRLLRYYMNGNDAYRLKLLLPEHPSQARHHTTAGSPTAAVEDEEWVAEQIQRLGVAGSSAQGAAGSSAQGAQQPPPAAAAAAAVASGDSAAEGRAGGSSG